MIHMLIISYITPWVQKIFGTKDAQKIVNIWKKDEVDPKGGFTNLDFNGTNFLHSMQPFLFLLQRFESSPNWKGFEEKTNFQQQEHLILFSDESYLFLFFFQLDPMVYFHLKVFFYYFIRMESTNTHPTLRKHHPLQEKQVTQEGLAPPQKKLQRTALGPHLPA